MTPDLYIAAMGRSGSTLLSNMLTCPPNYIVFNEPKFHLPPYRNLLHPQLERMNMELDPISVAQVKDLTPPAQLEALLGRRLRHCKWGMKEVSCDEHQRVMSLFHPRHVIINVRNVYDVALSFFEKHQRQGNENIFTIEWVRTYCLKETEGLLKLHQELEDEGLPSTIVRYEEITSGPEYCTWLSQVLNWPITGATHRGMEALNRQFEVERHGQRIGTPINAAERDLDLREIDEAKRIEEMCQPYLEYFGYKKRHKT